MAGESFLKSWITTKARANPVYGKNISLMIFSSQPTLKLLMPVTSILGEQWFNILHYQWQERNLQHMKNCEILHMNFWEGVLEYLALHFGAFVLEASVS